MRQPCLSDKQKCLNVTQKQNNSLSSSLCPDAMLVCERRIYLLMGQ